jgi:hypothetical protein
MDEIYGDCRGMSNDEVVMGGTGGSPSSLPYGRPLALLGLPAPPPPPTMGRIPPAFNSTGVAAAVGSSVRGQGFIPTVSNSSSATSAYAFSNSAAATESTHSKRIPIANKNSLASFSKSITNNEENRREARIEAKQQRMKEKQDKAAASRLAFLSSHTFTGLTYTGGIPDSTIPPKNTSINPDWTLDILDLEDQLALTSADELKDNKPGSYTPYGINIEELVTALNGPDRFKLTGKESLPLVIDKHYSEYIIPYNHDASVTAHYASFFSSLYLFYGIQDVVRPQDFGLIKVPNFGTYLDTGSEALEAYYPEFLTNIVGENTKYIFDLDKIGLTSIKDTTLVCSANKSEVTIEITLGGRKGTMIFNTRSGEQTRGDIRMVGNDERPTFIYELDNTGRLIVILGKALGDAIKVIMCKIYNEYWNNEDGTKNKTISLTGDAELYFRSILYETNCIYAQPAGSGHDKRFLLNYVGQYYIPEAKTAAGISGGKRRTRSKKNKIQKGGGDGISIREELHNAYLQFLFALIKSYCDELIEFMNESHNEEDIRKVKEVYTFLQSEHLKTYLENIPKDQPAYSYLKTLSSWNPDRILYRPINMKTKFNGSSSKVFEFHSIPKIFPMHDDIITIPGQSFKNNFTPSFVFTPFEMHSNPDFSNILDIISEYYDDEAKEVLKGGITSENKNVFDRMLDHVATNTDIKVQDILKELFLVLFKNAKEASRVYNLFSLYVTFHGYYILNYETIQKFVAILNENSGKFPGGFDGMKELVEGESKEVMPTKEAAPMIQEIYTPPIKDPKLEELKSSREVFSNNEESSELVEPEFQPSMIAAAAAGGRRTRRRKANKVKVKGTRRNRLTKKERNS